MGGKGGFGSLLRSMKPKAKENQNESNLSHSVYRARFGALGDLSTHTSLDCRVASVIVVLPRD